MIEIKYRGFTVEVWKDEDNDLWRAYPVIDGKTIEVVSWDFREVENAVEAMIDKELDKEGV